MKTAPVIDRGRFSFEKPLPHSAGELLRILEQKFKISKTVDFTDKKGLTSLYVNPLLQDYWQRVFHKAVEVCVEVVETLKIKDLPKIRMQDAGEISGSKIL